MTQQTRSRILAGLLSVAVLLPAAAFNSACRGKRATTVQNDEGTPQPVNLPPASSLKMSDAGAPGQIVRGVYPLEANAWRWTAGNFSILLKTPPGAAQKGATVSLTLVVSDAVLKQVKSQTLTASVGDKSVGSEKYTTAGDFAADHNEISSTIDINQSAEYAMHRLASNNTLITVLDEGKVAGILTRQNVLRFIDIHTVAKRAYPQDKSVTQ